MEPRVIYQDDDLFVLDKPPGWVVNSSETTKNLLVLQDWFKENFKYEIVNSLEMRSGIVHRLDKDTSGVLLVAKTAESFTKLQAEFKERSVKKEYVALVWGKVKETSGEISEAVGRLPWNRRKFGVLPGGREAQTKYEVINLFEKNGEDFTLLKLFPRTGRTHQIRIHLKFLGNPIVADKTYAGRKHWRYSRDWCPRIFLHAQKISFIHPKSGKQMTFEVDLPEDLKKALETIS